MTPYEQGRNDARTGYVKTNPYAKGTPHAQAWENGYTDQRIYMTRLYNARVENDARKARAARVYGGSYGRVLGW